MKNYKVIGLMSGTSLDGLDIAYCHFSQVASGWKYKIEVAETIPYGKAIKSLLGNINEGSGIQLTQAEIDFGRFMGKEVEKFIKKHSLKPDFISSHGHTIFHQPENGFTLQIGSGATLSAILGLPVVSDFRSLDVAMGGQGAPLVPIGDKLLFQDHALCLNLGGIANISFDNGTKRIAFDICPVNIVLNKLAAERKLEYDKDGKLAKKGKVDEALLLQLDKLDFYKQPFPKSLGREWIEKNISPLLNKSKISLEDKLATFCYHIAFQIAAVLKSYNSKNKNAKEASVLLTGGGAFNKFLVELIEGNAAANMKTIVPDKEIVSFKEALIFAFLGVLRVRNEVNCLSSVTGAKSDTVGGALHGNFKKLLR